MFKRLVMILCLGVTLLAGGTGAAQAILLGNHQITLDLLGTTQYFEFADIKEYEFQNQLIADAAAGETVPGLDWGFRLMDLNDFEFHDPSIPHDSPLQNRNQIKLGFVGNLDIGLRIRTALRPRWGIEGYIKYTPVDLVLEYNGQELSSSTFTRYSGVTNPGDAEDDWNWVKGDYPTYRIIRFGANIDYVFLRARANTINLYGALGAGAVSYNMDGELFIPTDYDEDEQDAPSAPEKISYYLPNDTFLSGNLGLGGIFFLHRMFGINVDFRASYSPFEMKRIQSFETKESHWIWSASIGYTWRLG